MIIIHVMGGLGNQLYQYAMYEKLKSLGREVKLDFHDYIDATGEDKEWRDLELTKFPNLSLDTCTQEERTAFLDNSLAITARIRRKLTGRKSRKFVETAVYLPEIFEKDEVYLDGYWCCEKYYEDILSLLQKNLIFPASGNIRNEQTMQQMQQENSVSIHIRRTDYLEVADGKRYMGICTVQYYDAAIAYIRKKIENPVFYIFSDDLIYAKEHFQGDDMQIVDWNSGKDSMFDMQLMSYCKHNICANSTFSEWGARLNTNPEKIMIRPLHHDNYETMDAKEIQDLWKNWILIDEKGQVK